MDNVVVFDLETQYIASEVGGWGNIRDMRLAVGVTYHVAEDAYQTYQEHDSELLVATLRAADLVVGYNLLRFDYEVLSRYTSDSLCDLPTVDMLDHIRAVLGWRPKLDNVAAATLGETKSADGLQAVRWFREGQLEKVKEYCQRDVELTWRVYRFGQQNRHVLVQDRRWRPLKVPVKW